MPGIQLETKNKNLEDVWVICENKETCPQAHFRESD
jgi:hypothetical protein